MNGKEYILNEEYSNIVYNKPLNPKDFVFHVPPKMKLVKTFQKNH